MRCTGKLHAPLVLRPKPWPSLVADGASERSLQTRPATRWRAPHPCAQRSLTPLAPPALRPQHKDAAGWEELGGLEGVASGLHTSLSSGVAATEVGPQGLEARRAAFGANRFKAIPPKSFLSLWFGNLRDPTLIMVRPPGGEAIERCGGWLRGGSAASSTAGAAGACGAPPSSWCVGCQGGAGSRQRSKGGWRLRGDRAHRAARRAAWKLSGREGMALTAAAGQHCAVMPAPAPPPPPVADPSRVAPPVRHPRPTGTLAALTAKH